MKFSSLRILSLLILLLAFCTSAMALPVVLHASSDDYDDEGEYAPGTSNSYWKTLHYGDDFYYTWAVRTDTFDHEYDYSGDDYIYDEFDVTGLAVYAKLKFYLEYNGGIGGDADASYNLR